MHGFTIPDGATWTERPLNGGTQVHVDFPNKWGASVVRHTYSYGSDKGLWELAVLNAAGDLDYRHPVSKGDVRGHLSVEEVNALLAEISATTETTPMLSDDPRTPAEVFERGLEALDSLARSLAKGD